MASLTLSGFVQNPVSGAGVPGARVYVFGRDSAGNKMTASPNPDPYDDTEVTGRYDIVVDTVAVPTTAGKGYHIEFRNMVAPNQTRIIRTDVEFQVKYIHGLQDGHGLIPAPLMDGSIKTEMLANADASKDRGISLAKMLPNSVGTTQLIDANVTLGKLATDSVNASKIIDGSVGTLELANLAVTQAKLATDSVIGGVNAGALGKIAANTIFDYNINTAANILGSKLADNSVPLAKLNFDVATQTELNAHTARTDNPHSVTLAQVGGATAGHNHDAAYDARYVNIGGDQMTGDLMLYRAGTPAVGVLYLGNSAARYLSYDSTKYELVNAPLFVNNLEVITTGNIGGQSVNYATTAGNANALGGQGIGYFSPASHTHAAVTGLPLAKVAIGNYTGNGDGSAGGRTLGGFPVCFAFYSLMIVETASGTVWQLNQNARGSGVIPGAGPGSDEVFSANPYFSYLPSGGTIQIGKTNAGFGANTNLQTYEWVLIYATT